MILKHLNWRTLVGVALAVAAANTMAADSAVETGGFGAWIIDSLFEAGSLTNLPDQAGIIGTTLIPLSLIAMLVAVGIIVVKSIQHLLVVAQAKDIDQSPISMTWAPLHMVIAVTLIMPLPSGYSMGQYTAIWIAEQSNTLGNITAERALDYFETRGAITPPVLPSAQIAAKGIVASQICQKLNNDGGEFVENQGGTRISIAPRVMTDSELNAVGGTTSPEKSLTRTGVTFAREKAGGFSGGSKELNDYCGALAIQYTAAANTNLWGTEANLNLQKDPSDESDNGVTSVDTAFGKCDWGILCIASAEVALGDQREKAIKYFESAHKAAASKFINSATGDKGAAIANTLLWDMEDYYAGKLESEDAEAYIAAQQEEPKKIEAAVKQTVDLIDEMQNGVYKSYASALTSLQTSTTKDGDNFMETAKKVGWPIFGLYWFQYTNLSQRVMDSVEIQVAYTGDVDKFLQTFAVSVEDPLLQQRLSNRINNYVSALARKLQNSRFDATPGDADAPETGMGSTTMTVAQDALQIREAFPAMREELIANAKLGSLSPQNAIESFKQSVNSTLRGDIFPGMIYLLRQDNLVNALVNTGHNIITVTEVLYGVKVATKSIIKGYNQTIGTIGSGSNNEGGDGNDKGFFQKIWDMTVGGVAGTVMSVLGGVAKVVMFPLAVALNVIWTVFQDLWSFWFYIFLAGLFLAFYIPAMIMIQWLIGLVTWIIYIAEATIVIPLWGLLFTADMGQRAFAPQTAQQGFVHLLSILVYPSLMVIGFVLGLKIIDLGSTFLVDFLIVGLLNTTDGYVFGILSMGTGLIILGLASYQIITRVFSLTLELNDRAMSWIGNRQGFGEGQVEQQTRGGVVAAIGKVEMKGRMGHMPPGMENNSRPKGGKP
ncbi:MAG: hypothetical protein AWU57_2 [Marinobacter sp. T13-3]|nr:MAG: hypothetical protein AWU57_2 [Marinobacter sp. T13-3]